MVGKTRNIRRLVVALIALGVVIVGTAVTIALWPDPPDCGDEIGSHMSGGQALSDECLDEFQQGVQEVEDQAAAVSACHDALEQEHATKWTVPLEFDSTDIEETSDGYRVSGAAHFVTGTGTRNDHEYVCTVAAGDANVLNADLR